ncbi:hypothetical protein TD95_002944 [Thielaviopsis punctulata]|uniref:Prokaryotic-type class I peptide chain release factors domain-containing protein n=1 Tax=Thielaviopsis punctulata TaxID=72032 RepID=A0A0F4ZL86_9PEZI|nr:hypothetical protein TD95_002944 [Thielaviopsis punctulata]
MASIPKYSAIFKRPFSLLQARLARYEAFAANIDPADLAEAREWAKKFGADSIPKGNTVFSRSSGPGGQHVNKTESKAITTWPIHEVAGLVPRLMRPILRKSKYYVENSDSLSFAAQTSRQRSSNVDENKAKFLAELMRMYHETVPGESDPAKAERHNKMQAFHDKRLKSKKMQSNKKQNRKSSYDI